MIKWYWIFVSLSAGLTIGFGLTFFNLRHLLLLAVKKPGGSLRPPGEIKEEILEELENDNARQELIDKIKEVFEK